MNNADYIRKKVWKNLSKVAQPDTRFHLNFAEYIPDFQGSREATENILNLKEYKDCKYAFVTPDNCLTGVRKQMIDNEIPYVMSTYGIYRGFVLVEPKNVPQGSSLYAAWLDGAEHFGNYIKLYEIKNRQKFDLLITGASAVSKNGVRFGKGHGFFDLEWGMFSEIGVVDESTKIVALVHDCQFVQEDLNPNKTDILVDFIVTPTVVHSVQKRGARPKGIHWELLEDTQIENTPPIKELMQWRGI